jgi:FAD/FMN-containing dehydrogenase
LEEEAMTELMFARGPEAIDADALRGRVSGQVSMPGDPDWDEARQAWNLAVDQRPAAVVLAESAADVVAVVEFAREHGLRIAPQGTGHFAAAVGELARTILLKTSRMRGVEIDPVARRARAEAGVLWIEVVEPAAEHGLVALHGSSPDVGVVGYTLGGGMGWLARRNGLAANSVLAVELVTPDGRHVRADRDNEPDLFWAVRGGGGSFGIVTAIEFALYPLREVYAGWLIWPIERAGDVLPVWNEWQKTATRDVTSVYRLLRIPPLPDIPEPLRGRSVVVVEAAYVGDRAAGEELLQPLRALEPELDTFDVVPAASLSRLHMDPEGPTPGLGHGTMLDELPSEAFDALLAVAGPGVDTPLLSVELRQLGGALAEPSPEHGAVGTFDAKFAMFAVGLPADEEAAAAVDADVDRVLAALAPWQARRTYFNFSERPVGAERLYGELTLRRLRAIKGRVDPGELLAPAHPIAPSS